MGDADLAYELFQRAAAIDLGPDMMSSNAGVHAAALGGIWQSVVFGFGGVRMLQGKLRIEPKLPASWQQLGFDFFWHGQKIRFLADHERLKLEKLSGSEAVNFTCHGKEYMLDGELTLPL